MADRKDGVAPWTRQIHQNCGEPTARNTIDAESGSGATPLHRHVMNSCEAPAIGTQNFRTRLPSIGPVPLDGCPARRASVLRCSIGPRQSIGSGAHSASLRARSRPALCCVLVPPPHDPTQGWRAFGCRHLAHEARNLRSSHTRQQCSYGLRRRERQLLLLARAVTPSPLPRGGHRYRVSP